jgi:sugar/nucleoside kinase (ribokinase family)
MPLLVTGTIGIDTIHTPTGSAEGVPGGSCAYFAAAARLYTPVRVVAAVGGDWPAPHRELLAGLRGVCLKGLQVRPGSRTFAWGGRYMDHMNDRETLFTELGVLEEDPPPVPESYRDSRYIFLANTHPAVQAGLLDRFPDRRFAVADTMDLWINVAHSDLLALLRRVDGIILNDREAAQLTEMGNAVSAGRAILEMGPGFVVVKKGEHGAILIHREGVAIVPAFPADHTQVVDPTGAGDSFAGGFMGHVASTGGTGIADLQRAMAWGTVTASFAIEAFGLARIAKLRRHELESRFADFQAAARVG